MPEPGRESGAAVAGRPVRSQASLPPRADGPAARRFDIAATILFWIAVPPVLVHFFLLLYPLTEPSAADGASRIDFAVFWAAAKLMLTGEPLSAFDPDALFAAAGLPLAERPENMVWLYPASFLLLLAPLGALPFVAALPVFAAASWLALGLALRGPAAVLLGLWRVMLASPLVVLGCLTIGQTSVLWTAGLIAGLWAMRRGNAMAAGLAFALLTMKPQLGLLIPVALLVARQWAVIGWGAGFAAVLAAVATSVTGTAYWGLFLDALGAAVERASEGTAFLDLMVSGYGFLRALGLDHGTALVPQMLVTGGLVIVVGWVWSRRNLGDDLKCAVLCAAIPLATPYAYYYEMALEAAAALFLIRAGFGAGIWSRLWLLVLWLGPVPLLYLQTETSLPLVAPPILAITLAIAVARAWRENAARGVAAAG